MTRRIDRRPVGGKSTTWRAKAVEIPVRYSAMRFGPEGAYSAVGRDLRPLAACSNAWPRPNKGSSGNTRASGTPKRRYRLLFQLAGEAVLIVDSASERIMEANPAAAALLGRRAQEDCKGKRSVSYSSTTAGQRPILLGCGSGCAARRQRPRPSGARSERRFVDRIAHIARKAAAHLIVLLSRLGEVGPISTQETNLLRFAEAMPEALILTNSDRRILTANAAFLDLIQATTVQQVHGEPIDRWIGRPGVEIDVLFANLRAHGSR